MHLIWCITNISFHGHFSFAYGTPPLTRDHMRVWMIFVPIVGGVIVGFMARYGLQAIRGHGIPEAMEQVLPNESRIPARITFLKPLSAAIAIGTGGPFGAEGPIIATGGALGSLIGQIHPDHRDGAKDAAGRRRRGGHGGDVRQPGVGRAAGGRTAAVRIPPALADPGRAARRPPRPACASLFVGVKPVFAMPDSSRRRRRRWPCYILLGARHRRRFRSA